MAHTSYSPDRPWPAPTAQAPLDAVVEVPGSKSLANRELVLAAIADAPGVIRKPLIARDTALCEAALVALGAEIVHAEGQLHVAPASLGEMTGEVSIDCGLAGTVMRFLPPLAALTKARVRFDGDEAARLRPMAAVLDALEVLGVTIERENGDALPFTVVGRGEVAGGALTIDASKSSQFVSALLLAAPLFTDGLTLRHEGAELPSLPHIEMTLACLRARGVNAQATGTASWRVEPGSIGARELTLEPDLSNAEPFLIAAIIAGGLVSIPSWPATTAQVGAQLAHLLPRFGAVCSLDQHGVFRCDGGDGILSGARPDGVELDLSEAGELAPNLAALCALCSTPSTLRGIGHLRGHETDRLAALATELTKIGASVEVLDDGLRITPGEPPSGTTHWHSYADHRMATSGALLGLAIPGIRVDDIACTSKTMPEFPTLWAGMLSRKAEVAE